MTCKRGDIVQVPFPFSDLSAMKKRPIMVLTDADAYGDFLAVGLTSRSHHSDSIPIARTDLTSGALPIDSWVRIDRVITLNCRLTLKTYGQTTSDFIIQVLDAVCERARKSDA
ncbi:mRNA interferase MazF [Gammaproteobacteria bacterium]